MLTDDFTRLLTLYRLPCISILEHCTSYKIGKWCFSITAITCKMLEICTNISLKLQSRVDWLKRAEI